MISGLNNWRSKAGVVNMSTPLNRQRYNWKSFHRKFNLSAWMRFQFQRQVQINCMKLKVTLFKLQKGSCHWIWKKPETTNPSTTRYLHNANKCCLRLQLFVKFFISDMGTLLWRDSRVFLGRFHMGEICPPPPPFGGQVQGDKALLGEWHSWGGHRPYWGGTNFDRLYCKRKVLLLSSCNAIYLLRFY